MRLKSHKLIKIPWGGLSIIFCNEPDFVAVERGVVLLDVLIYCVFALGAAVWERDFGGVELPGGAGKARGGGGEGVDSP